MKNVIKQPIYQFCGNVVCLVIIDTEPELNLSEVVLSIHCYNSNMESNIKIFRSVL